MMRGRVAGTAVQRRDFCCENERGFYMNERREEGRGDNDKGGDQKKMRENWNRGCCLHYCLPIICTQQIINSRI